MKLGIIDWKLLGLPNTAKPSINDQGYELWRPLS